MARPLKGRVMLRGGKFQGSVPKAKGSTERHYEVFDAKAQAEAWCALAVANLQAGLPLPSRRAVLGEGDPDVATMSRRSLPKRALARPLSVTEVADDWFHEVYIDGRSGGAERAKNVRSILNRRVVPFLLETLDDSRLLTREKYRAYLAALGRPSTEPVQGMRTIRGLNFAYSFGSTETARRNSQFNRIAHREIPRGACLIYCHTCYRHGRSRAHRRRLIVLDIGRCLLETHMRTPLQQLADQILRGQGI